MMSQIRKVIIVSVTLAHAILFIFIHISFALETETHKAINNYVAQRSLNGFSLNDYLKTALGIQSGTEDYFRKDGLDQEAFKWLGDGGVYEDNPPDFLPFLRSLNHFHNPIDDSGFSALWNIEFFSGVSAIQWALLPENSQSRGHYSWNHICTLIKERLS
jgi:hypothetical protein